ncbi:XRE family transcriptional regulator [Romboutsia weinsteinii]|uniref:XRE family transcriptional regulator n=1 Tax=Romboutsia weinsteinii TaxID=2020949 RepID=A0A255I653_9FIRM|nr:helix-turn-helix transcriptional regulator [Romboutsia weinsteinii]RDY26296.1 XRE family transcriptional regulator [Romboutsia weinsteinii]
MNERLKILRKQLGLSQKEFGEKIHLSVSQISSYENKSRNIPERSILNIIREFNVSSNWIRFGTGDIFNSDLCSTSDLIKKINSLSKEDQQFINRIIDCLYNSSSNSKILDR